MMKDGYVPMDITLYRWESIVKQISDSQVKHGQQGKQERRAIQRIRCGYKGISEGSWSKCVSHRNLKEQHKPGLVFTWPSAEQARMTEMLNFCGARNTEEGIDPLLGGNGREKAELLISILFIFFPPIFQPQVSKCLQQVEIIHTYPHLKSPIPVIIPPQ